MESASRTRANAGQKVLWCAMISRHSERSAEGARVPANSGQMRNRERPGRGSSTGRFTIPRLPSLALGVARNDSRFLDYGCASRGLRSE
jgi:hypothetical protein